MLDEYRDRKKNYCLALDKAKFEYMEAVRVLSLFAMRYEKSVELLEIRSKEQNRAMENHNGIFYGSSAINPDTYDNSVKYCHHLIQECQVAEHEVAETRKDMLLAREKLLGFSDYISKLESRIDEICKEIDYLCDLQRDRMAGELFLISRHGK